MGKGIALEAVERYTGLAVILGEKLRRERQRSVFFLGDFGGRLLFAFTVKYNWFHPADMRLIERSCQELRDHPDLPRDEYIALVRPGCGAGQLAWADVRLVVQRLLPEPRWLIVSKPDEI